ncbi:hypothetical protein RhiirA5_421626 [Rhizophagus irregularis]|uniref:Uncharacterized protein n=1 Tax=Rhizophagus irregularis TaxID=588596 RepID=A0A2N0R911_9GLOM|nr:hypothetical protein RhiirA5_421626 [Rhizophagus irregularis]PKC59794.1 hypothetical protein RhiirA1_468929 [Rhizophagus irregularis]CAB4481873.1 unnamed protein product [Rhizophagus irregularis]
MNNNYPLQNNQQSTTNSVIRPEQNHSSNITYNNFSTYDNNNYTSTTPYVPYVNNNLNESIASTSHFYPLPSQQNVENPPNLLFNMANNSFPPNPFNMTNIISPFRSEIHTFEIPGYKVILIPTFSQYDNNHFTRFRQFR